MTAANETATSRARRHEWDAGLGSHSPEGSPASDPEQH
jgi:hypothetical protein